MVIFWVLTVCGGVIRQYGNFYQNYYNFSKIFFSVYISYIEAACQTRRVRVCMTYNIYMYNVPDFENRICAFICLLIFLFMFFFLNLVCFDNMGTFDEKRIEWRT